MAARGQAVALTNGLASRSGEATEPGLDEIYDLIGIGLGPASLTLGICLEEETESSAGHDLKWIFLEAKPHAVWHPGLLLESTSIQNSVLKDLPGFLPGAYVQGRAESTHGVSETVLSLMPIRAGEISQSILAAAGARCAAAECVNS